MSCVKLDRHCEEPTGRANAHPMTGSATNQSIRSPVPDSGLLRVARNDGYAHRQCNSRVSSKLINFPTASPNSDRMTTPANS
jgi:hypothetical protein